jgi:predicted  nucleic acid-binding Zn-ribbon protein
MANPIPINISRTQANETEIAVLHVQFDNLSVNVDELRNQMKEESTSLRKDMKEHSETTNKLITALQKKSSEDHSEIVKKVADLEKWRWMLMGAGVVIGALGFETISKLLGMG